MLTTRGGLGELQEVFCGEEPMRFGPFCLLLSGMQIAIMFKDHRGIVLKSGKWLRYLPILACISGIAGMQLAGPRGLGILLQQSHTY